MSFPVAAWLLLQQVLRNPTADVYRREEEERHRRQQEQIERNKERNDNED